MAEIGNINKGAPRVRGYDNLAAAAHRVDPSNKFAWETALQAVQAAQLAVECASTDDVRDCAVRLEAAAEIALIETPASSPQQMIQKLLTAFMTDDGEPSALSDIDAPALFREAQKFMAEPDDEPAPQRRALAQNLIFEHGQLRVALQQTGAILNAATMHDCSTECSLLVTAALDQISYALAEDDRAYAAGDTGQVPL